MKRVFMSLSLIACFANLTFAQGAKNIKINEVLTNNTESLLDEYGTRLPWLELANTSFSTYDIRGMYIATDRAVLDKTLSVPQRIKMMSQIPSGNDISILSAQEHGLYFLNSSSAKGYTHLEAKVDVEKPLWIGLYDGNAVDLIDSVTVPVLKENCSYARYKNKEKQVAWEVKQPEFVSPGTANITSVSESKIAKLKREDPHGFGITILAMGVVFTCLALLYLSFFCLGKIMNRSKTVHDIVNLDEAGNLKLDISRSKSADNNEAEEKTPDKENENKEVKQDIPDEIVAVIAQAIQDYQDDVHVEESGVITLVPHETRWHN